MSTAATSYNKTISESLRYYADIQPDLKAFIFVTVDEESDVVTWKDLYEKSVKAARGLMQLGVKRHEFVAVNMRSCPEWLYVNFGVILAGARAVNISFTYIHDSDVIAMMKKLQTCSTMVLDAGDDDKNWNIFQKLLDNYSAEGNVKSAAMPYLRYLVLLDRPNNTTNVKTVTEVIQGVYAESDLPIVDEKEIISLFQTSGSTGIPKVVAHTHETLTALGWSMNKLEFGKEIVDPRCEVLYNDRPFTWVGGWPFNVFCGATRVTRSGMAKDPNDVVGFIFDVIKRERCSYMHSLPPMLHAMTERQAELGDSLMLQHIGTGGQPITTGIVKCAGSLCEQLSCGYGGTEFGMIAAATVNDKSQFLDYSCGHPLPGVEVKIVDDNGTTVPVGSSGEIYIKGKALFKEYWNDPQKTALVKTTDGWYKTDDMGHLSKDGSLFVEGRKSDMIISGGMNVCPVILESAIEKIPGVEAVIVVPIKHPVLYQVVCACVIAERGSNVTEESLRRHCESIHNDKPRLFTVLPKYYMIMEKFPETRTGKTSPKKLADMAEKQFNNK